MKINNKMILVIVAIIAVIFLFAQQPKEIKKSAGPGGATITRTVTPDSVAPVGIFTVTVTVTRGTEDMSGIIKMVKPASFTFYDSDNWVSTFDSKTEDIYGDNLDIAFTESGTSGYYEYKLQAGVASGTLTGLINWEGGTTDTLANAALNLCLDNDNDGYGSNVDRLGCTYSQLDCDDSDSQVYPGNTEICDGKDNDCDLILDGSEGLSQSCSNSNAYGICFGTADCNDAGVWSGCTAPTPEDEATQGSCDGIDNDCDGSIDETKNTQADGDCNALVCDGELLSDMTNWKNTHNNTDCDITDGCTSDTKLLSAMSVWKNTHRDISCT